MDFNEEYATLPEQLEFKTEYKTFLNELQDLVKKFYNNKCHEELYQIGMIMLLNNLRLLTMVI